MSLKLSKRLAQPTILCGIGLGIANIAISTSLNTIYIMVLCLFLFSNLLSFYFYRIRNREPCNGICQVYGFLQAGMIFLVGAVLFFAIEDPIPEDTCILLIVQSIMTGIFVICAQKIVNELIDKSRVVSEEEVELTKIPC